MNLTLFFRDSGFCGRQLAFLGDRAIGAVEPPGAAGRRALWSFYFDANRRKINQPAASIEKAREIVADETYTMLREFGLTLDEVRLTVVVEPARRATRAARARP
jgi:hypothetical protein